MCPDSFIYVTWPSTTCDMNDWYVRIHMCAIAHWCVPYRDGMCSMSHSYKWYDTLICVGIHVRDMTQSYAWHDSFTRATMLIHMLNMTHMTHSRAGGKHLYTWLCHYKWRDSLICMITHSCDMTHSYVEGQQLTNTYTPRITLYYDRHKHCDALQCSATHCTALQHAATHCNILHDDRHKDGTHSHNLTLSLLRAHYLSCALARSLTVSRALSRVFELSHAFLRSLKLSRALSLLFVHTHPHTHTNTLSVSVSVSVSVSLPPFLSF